MYAVCRACMHAQFNTAADLELHDCACIHV